LALRGKILNSFGLPLQPNKNIQNILFFINLKKRQTLQLALVRALG
jgi:hypothetical protein